MTNIGSQLIEAATLMLTGMGVVFTFLTILIFIIRLMSTWVPQEVPETRVAAKTIKANQLTSSTVSPQVVAAISAAIQQHRASIAK